MSVDLLRWRIRNHSIDSHGSALGLVANVRNDKEIVLPSKFKRHSVAFLISPQPSIITPVWKLVPTQHAICSRSLSEKHFGELAS